MAKRQKMEQKQIVPAQNLEKNKADREEIARVAYELYEKRGCAHGCDREDWLKAEAIVKQGGRR